MPASSSTPESLPLSARALARMAQPRFAGELTEDDARLRGCTLIATEHGAQQSPEHIRLTMLVDSSGIVSDVRYATSAGDLQRATYDIMAELCVGRSLAEAAMVTPREVDAQLRDVHGGPVLELVASNHSDADHPFYVLRKAAERHLGVQVAAGTPPTGTPPPGAPPAGAQPDSAGNWGSIGLFEKVRRIEQVLDTQVRPALASDGGGIDLVDLKGDALYVQYHGACGSCSSSIGGTLQFITDSLNNHLGTTLSIQVSGTDEGDSGDSIIGI